MHKWYNIGVDNKFNYKTEMARENSYRYKLLPENYYCLFKRIKTIKNSFKKIG